jgi:hypothetical protein
MGLGSQENVMFTLENIRNRLKQAPFIPFYFVTSAGEKYHVAHPELVLLGRREAVIVGTPNTKDPGIADQIFRLSILHITAMDDCPAPLPAGSNGQAK